MVVRDAVGGKQLMPLPGAPFDDHAQWGVCQVGTAAAFVKDEDLEADDGDLALFGAPGCFTWRGNVFGQDVGTVQRYDVAVTQDSIRQFSKHGHMGLSVTSGRFFHREVYYVSGAPHAGQEDDRVGEIHFFSKNTAGSSSSNHFEPHPELTLRGEVFGAGFGYSLVSVDANGDANPDLLVGAPFHDGGKTGRGGAVYLYLSNQGSLDRGRKVKIIGRKLESQFGLSMTTLGDLNRDGYDDFAVGAPYEEGGGAVYVFFGGPKGLRSLGPSEDFYEAEMIADQVIIASELSSHVSVVDESLATFGSSLSGGMDMDGNGYPDLLVGAYQSEKVFLLRSRPIIDITTTVDESNLKGIDPGQAGCEEDPSSEDTCFDFTACFSVENKEVRGLDLEFMIEAEPQKPMSRVWLRRVGDENGGENRTNTISHTIRIERLRKMTCTTVVAYVSTHADLQTPVQFAMSYSLVQEAPTMSYRRGTSLPDINDFPILNQSQAKKRFQATFDKDCGADDVCQSQVVLKPTLKDKNGNELPRTPGGYYELELGSLDGSELVLDVLVENEGESAYEAELDVMFPSDVSYVGLGEDARHIMPELKNDTWLHLRLGNPFKGRDEETQEPHTANLQLRFSTRNGVNEKLIQFYLTANTSSEQVYDASTFVNLMIVRRAELKVIGAGSPSEVHYGGVGSVVKGESAFDELAQIGPQVVHRFLVQNKGPSDVQMLTVEIGWPFQVENGKSQGKWLLYLTDHPLLKNGRGDCVLPRGYRANPLNLTGGSVFQDGGISARHAPETSLVMPKEEFMSRRDEEATFKVHLGQQHQEVRPKREVEKVISPQELRLDDDKTLNVVTFDCDRGTAKCLRINCQIFNLAADKSATIEIRSRVWNSTLLDDYSFAGAGIDLVEIYSKAKVSVNDVVTQDISDDYVSVKTVARPEARGLPQDGRPEWWVILAAALVGLLVLVIISLILWKCGFFKRRRPLGSPEDDDSEFMMSAHFEKVRLNGNNDM